MNAHPPLATTLAQSVHIIAGISAKDGGPSYSVPRLVEALRPFGRDVVTRSLRTSDLLDAPDPDRAMLSNRSNWPILNSLAWSGDLRASLAADAANGALLHTHGLWLMPNVYPAWERRRLQNGCRLVHSPRGMLGAEALRISAWKKRLVWHLWQREALKAADAIHATAVSEYQEIRAAGLTNPVAIIPNGIDLPELKARDDYHSSEGPKRVILSLGRVHPKKALDRMIRAWAQIQVRLPNWTLRIVGPAELNHDIELRALATSLGAKRVEIDGALYGEQKWTAYRSADLFVLPTLNENFAMSVAEALASEVPVISTKGAPWSGLERERCGWWIEHGVEPMAAALLAATSLPTDELRDMGQRGRAWMARDFGWDRIGREMAGLYGWLQHGGDVPATVRLD